MAALCKLTQFADAEFSEENGTKMIANIVLNATYPFVPPEMEFKK